MNPHLHAPVHSPRARRGRRAATPRDLWRSGSGFQNHAGTNFENILLERYFTIVYGFQVAAFLSEILLSAREAIQNICIRIFAAQLALFCGGEDRPVVAGEDRGRAPAAHAAAHAEVGPARAALEEGRFKLRSEVSTPTGSAVKSEGHIASRSTSRKIVHLQNLSSSQQIRFY